MKDKEQSAKQNAFEFSVDYKPFETDLDYREYAEYGFERGFLDGYNAGLEKVKEYLFNTEEHQDKDDKFYISEEYLKQTIEFLNG